MKWATITSIFRHVPWWDIAMNGHNLTSLGAWVDMPHIKPKKAPGTEAMELLKNLDGNF